MDLELQQHHSKEMRKMRPTLIVVLLAVATCSILAGCKENVISADEAFEALNQTGPGNASVHDVVAARQKDGNVRIEFTIRPDPWYGSPIEPQSIVVDGEDVVIIDGHLHGVANREFYLEKGRLFIRPRFN